MEYLNNWKWILPILDYCCIFSGAHLFAPPDMYFTMPLISHPKHTVQPYWDFCRHANSATLEWPINDIKHSTQEVGHLSGLSPQQKMFKYQHIAMAEEVIFFGYASFAKRLMHSAGLAFCGICTSFSDSGQPRGIPCLGRVEDYDNWCLKQIIVLI